MDIKTGSIAIIPIEPAQSRGVYPSQYSVDDLL
jgi:hypothetical protein